jgi:hypothetical protein
MKRYLVLICLLGLSFGGLITERVYVTPTANGKWQSANITIIGNGNIISVNNAAGLNIKTGSGRMNVSGTVSASALQVNGVATFAGSSNIESIVVSASGVATALQLVRGGVNLGKISSNGNLFIINGQNNKDLQFADDSGNGILIKDGGDVGIGTTAPSTKLEVAGAITATGGGNNVNEPAIGLANNKLIVFNGSDGVGSCGAFYYSNSDQMNYVVDNGTRANMTATGFSIGNSTYPATTALEVAGTVSANAINLTALPAANQTALYVSATGVVSKATSSRRYKTNISDLDINSELIYMVEPKSWNYINDKVVITTENVQISATQNIVKEIRTAVKEVGQKNIGPIAEDVEEYLPELVNHDSLGRPDSLKDSQFVWLLLEEVKKLKARIEVLEAR